MRVGGKRRREGGREKEAGKFNTTGVAYAAFLFSILHWSTFYHMYQLVVLSVLALLYKNNFMWYF